MRVVFTVVFVLVGLCLVYSQSDSVKPSEIVIRSIQLEGNRKTKDNVILRELDFNVGDTLRLNRVTARFEQSKNRVVNTNLFSTVNFTIYSQDSTLTDTVRIIVTERWYIYPSPIFELADRNFNVWWKEFNRSLKRVNYGLDWTQLNLTGRNDILRGKVQFGYNTRFDVQYRCPGINEKQTLGVEATIFYNRRHELAVKTAENKLDFHVNQNEWLLTEWVGSLGFVWRPKLLTTQVFSLEYRNNSVTDSIISFYNPDFFLSGSTRQRYFSASYSFVYDFRDIRAYPLKGSYSRMELRKNGLLPTDDYQHFRAFFEHAQYIKLKSWLYAEVIGKARVSLPRTKQPYFNNQGLGYGGSFVRGFEYYVIDGLDFGLLKTGLHLRFLNRSFNLKKWMPFKNYRIVPLSLFLAFNNDVGYANDPYYKTNNALNNRFLYGYGLGLDVLAYQIMTLRMEYSWNDLGESGFFLRINTGI